MAKDLLTGALVGGVAASVVVLSTQAFAGTGIGATFDLGRSNTVNATSTLSGSTSGRSLQLTNRGSGPALGLTVRAGKAPLVVSPKAGKAVNLDADKLDGISAHGFLHASDLTLSQQHGWLLYAGSGGVVDDFANLVDLNGTGTYLLPLTTPDTIGVHDFYLDNVEVCYATATSGDKIAITQVFRSTADAAGVDRTVLDTSDHTGAFPTTTCYTTSVNDTVAPANSVYTLELQTVGQVYVVRVTSTFKRTF